MIDLEFLKAIHAASEASKIHPGENREAYEERVWLTEFEECWTTEAQIAAWKACYEAVPELIAEIERLRK